MFEEFDNNSNTNKQKDSCFGATDQVGRLIVKGLVNINYSRKIVVRSVEQQ